MNFRWYLCGRLEKYLNMSGVLKTTLDGSSTLYLPEMDEHYHSTNGARSESMHVYIDAGYRATDANPVSVLEIGFGTGLNAWLTLSEATATNRPTNYIAIELFPLSMDVVDQLSYSKGEGGDLYRQIHTTEWEKRVDISPYFNLQKIKTDLASFIPPKGMDVVYFDAFAPDKQPEMWQSIYFERLFASMNSGGLLTTYCAKGVVRRMLIAAGFEVERLPGPLGKREILRAFRK